MTDLELAQFLEIADDGRWPQVIASLEPGQRYGYERLADACARLCEWQAGIGPEPTDLIVCRD